MVKFSLKKKLWGQSGEMNLDVQMELVPGEFMVLFGESGSGKTSVLRMLAGLLLPDSGRISCGGEIWLDTAQKIDIKPAKRSLSMMFQDYALFPNMTVRENLVFALKKNSALSVVEELLEVMDLRQIAQARPGRLSGGQQQRVALARSLVRETDLLLLDEPFSALDEDMRGRLQHYLLDLHRQRGSTVIMVSHQHAEVIKMADRVAVLKAGEIIAQGSTEVLFAGNPVTGSGIPGKLLSVEEKAGAYFAMVLMGGHVQRIEITEEKAGSMRIGEQVRVGSDHYYLE